MQLDSAGNGKGGVALRQGMHTNCKEVLARGLNSDECFAIRPDRSFANMQHCNLTAIKLVPVCESMLVLVIVV